MKRLALVVLLLTALGGSAFLALHRPGAQASPGPIITVNGTHDADWRNDVMTLREAILLATGDLHVDQLTHLECDQVSDTYWVSGRCVSPAPPSADSADTIVFDTGVFPPGSPATHDVGPGAFLLDKGNDTVDGSAAGVIIKARASMFNCFEITSSNNTIKGLEIHDCENGIALSGDGDNNTIGGSTDGDGNVIYGNDTGIAILGGDGNVVMGNYIGTNADGDAAIPNRTGIFFNGATENTIGGNSDAERNVISGNSSEGMYLTSSYDNVITGNYIGTNASGDAGVPNGTGMHVSASTNNTIGGIAPGAGNLIAFNSDAGVVVGHWATGDAIRRNSIHSNGGKGIENEDGGNTELAPPVITGFGPVSGTACPNCSIDLFSDDEDEGRVFEGSAAADGGGNWSFPPGSPEGPNVTATVTDAAGNTSEFSTPVTVPEPTPTPSPTPTPTPTATATATATATPGGTRTVTIPAGSWANFAWTGDSTPQTVADCFGASNIAVMYRLDAATQTFQRWIRGRDDLSNMSDIVSFDALLALNAGAQPATCTMPQGLPGGVPTILPAGGWANFVWQGNVGMPADVVAEACGIGNIAVIYRLDAASQTFQRWVRGRPDLSNMTDVQPYDAVLARNGSDQPSTCAFPVIVM